MNEDIIASIEDLGLSQKEARVYLASLILGPATVQKIADQSGIKRVTTYVILESLNNLGLVSQSIKGKKTYFVAEEPTQLRRLLEKKEDSIKEQKSHFETILPDLNKLKELSVESPNVRFYDTPEGIRSIMADFLVTHRREGINIIYGMSNLDQLHSFFPEFAKSGGNPDRIRAQVASKFIYTTAEGPIMKSTDKSMNRESRFVSMEEYPLNGDLSILGNHIVMLALTGSKPIGVTIESEQLAKTMLSLFNLAWETASKYN